MEFRYFLALNLPRILKCQR